MIKQKEKCPACDDTGWIWDGGSFYCTACDAFDPDDEAGIGQIDGLRRHGLLMVEPGRWAHKSGQLIIREPGTTDGLWLVAEEFHDRLEIDRSIPAGSLRVQAKLLDDLVLGRKPRV